MRQQCALEANMVNGITGCMRTAVATRLKQVILSLYSILLRPSLEYCIHFWATQYNRDLELLERDQCRATKIVKAPEHSFCGERLSKM